MITIDNNNNNDKNCLVDTFIEYIKSCFIHGLSPR